MADAPEQPLVAADGDQALLKCDRCALPVPETDLSAKKATHSKLTECKSCRSLMSWLAYHVSPSEVFNKMSTEEVTDFFQRALDERKKHGGVLKHAVVRSNLLKHFQKKIVDVSKRSAGNYKYKERRENNHAIQKSMSE